MKATLALMLKAPLEGQVKTRLALEIGDKRAVSAYRRMVEYLVDAVGRESPMEIHVAPAGAIEGMRDWLGESYSYFPQSGGDLGRRLISAGRASFRRGAEGVIFLGGDCPYVSRQTIAKAERALVRKDVVVGPALDGGYYLLGIRKWESGIFAGIHWGTDRVLAQTRDRLGALGLSFHQLEALEDVDDGETWKRAEAFLNRVATAPTRAAITRSNGSR